MNSIWSGSHLHTNSGTKGLSKMPARPPAIFTNNGVINTSSPACIRQRQKYENHIAKNHKTQHTCHHEKHQHDAAKAKSNEELHKSRVTHQHGLRQSCSCCQIHQKTRPSPPELRKKQSSSKQSKKEDFDRHSDLQPSDPVLIKRNRSPSAPHIVFNSTDDITRISSSPWIERNENGLNTKSRSHKKKTYDTATKPSEKPSPPSNSTKQETVNPDTSTRNDIEDGQMKYVFKETSV